MNWNETIQQGSFTADGSVKELQIRSDFDWIRVYNETAQYQTTADLPCEFYWRRGMTNGRGTQWTLLGNVANDPMTVGQIAANSGFLTVDTSSDSGQLAAGIAITSATDATEPVFDTGTTTNLSDGTIVRLSGMTGQESLNGMDFAIDTIVGSTSFKMAAALATAPGAAASAGTYRIVRYYRGYVPRWRYICDISLATSAVITTTVPSGYAVGQKLRVVVPTTEQAGVSDYGMVEIDGLIGTVTAVTNTVGTQTVTLDIDSSGFTAFTFPTAAKAAVALSHALLVPAGADDPGSITEDDIDNVNFIGVRLLNPQSAGTASGPAGATDDIMTWMAGKSGLVTNE